VYLAAGFASYGKFLDKHQTRWMTY